MNIANKGALIRFIFFSVVIIGLSIFLLLNVFRRGRTATGPSIDLPQNLCRENEDSTNLIQTFLKTLSANSTVIFPAAKTCLIAQSISLPGKLTYDLNGAILVRNDEPEYDKSMPLVKFEDVSDVTIKNGTIRGALIRGSVPQYDGKRAKYHGIQAWGAQNVTISDMTIKDVNGDCVDIDGYGEQRSKNITIRNVICSGAGRQGISSSNGEGILIDQVDFDFIGRSGVDLEPRPNAAIKNVTIQNSTFRWIKNFAFAMVGSSPTMSNIVIQNNTQPGCEGRATGNVCLAPFAKIGNKYIRGPLTIKNNMTLGRIQIKKMSGEVSGNVMTQKYMDDVCFITSISASDLSVHGNTPHTGIKEVCYWERRAGDLSGSQVIPTVTTGASGDAEVLYSLDTPAAEVTLSFDSLSSETTAVHIHGPAEAGKNAEVLFDLPLAEFEEGKLKDYQINLTDSQRDDLKKGLWYIDVHTSNYPNGEVRGQLLERFATSSPKPTDKKTPISGTPLPTSRNQTGLNVSMKLLFQGIISKPQDKYNTLPVKVILIGPQGSSQSKTVTFSADEKGVWTGKTTFTSIPGQGFAVLVKGPKHIQKKICVAEPTETAPGSYRCTTGAISLAETNGIYTNLDFSKIRLLVGDLPQQDGIVDSYDISFIRNNLGKTDPAVLAIADLNLDGIVDSQDYSLLIATLSVKYDEE